MSGHGGLFAVPVPAPTNAGRYRTIVADPPWMERGAGKVKRGADRHYPLMQTVQVAMLPVRSWAADDAHLYLWATNNFLVDGLRVMAEWGFRYVTKIDWVKIDGAEPDDGWSEDDNDAVQIGLGQYFRGASESCLFGVRGRCEYRYDAMGNRQQGATAILAARTRKHSEKPPHLRLMAERVSHAPRLEMFARNAVDGWDAWGLETPEMDALRALTAA